MEARGFKDATGGLWGIDWWLIQESNESVNNNVMVVLWFRVSGTGSLCSNVRLLQYWSLHDDRKTVSRMLHLARNLPKCFDIREIVTIVLLGGVFFRCSTLSVLFKYEITANRLIQWIKGINGRIQLRHTSDHSEFIPLFGRGRANTSFVKNAKACWVCKSLIGL